jgi:nitrous oxide reductase accessory protein NosL
MDHADLKNGIMKNRKDIAWGRNRRRGWIPYAILITAVTLFFDLHDSVRAEDPATGPKPALQPLDQSGKMHISRQDRCPVCAMKVSKHPKFACAIELKSGKTYYFCGTGCMIRSWMHPEIFLGISKQGLKRPVVQDYFSGDQVDGRSVFWVAGSDVIGPMGPALVPLKNEAHLDAFKKRHGAKTIFRLSDMTDEKWLQLTGKKVLPQK